MPETMATTIEALRNLPAKALREKYKEAFGCREVPSSNRDYLWRRIAYRLQEADSGGLSEGARLKIEALKSGEITGASPRTAKPRLGSSDAGDRRVPSPGTVLRRPYKGQTVEVKVLKEGFEHQGRVYRTLTAVAKEVTGSHWNGFLFFGLA